MLPRIVPESSIDKNYQQFLADLGQTVFSGQINIDYATRLAVAVDNSIYQVIPQAVIFPRNTSDIAAILQLAHHESYREHIQFCPRGGGTSTNGQSLSAGIILDCSKYMREIIEINLDEQWVLVQPGVVLDQLNAYLQSFDVCFAPEISPSNRATIGGMVNTDACGAGSRIVGRTSDHVIDLTCVLNTGQIVKTSELNEKNNWLGQQVLQLIQAQQTLINEKFTSAPRTLNGYNLKKALINLHYLFCGSEGTLAIISECKLKLTPISKFKRLLIVKYRSFDDALRTIDMDETVKPHAIEAIDEKLIDLARNDAIYFYLQDFIDGPHAHVRAVNIVEFIANDEQTLEKNVADYCKRIDDNKNNSHSAIGFYIAKNSEEIKLIWELRKKSVGLISKERDGTRRPIPFIEDTAVPPEKLADYISEFKKLLDGCQLHYGMYGHVDAGCVHVRPALDMKITHDEKLIRELSNKVVALIEKYQGILWGEHGLGYRSEFGERFFGATLYHLVRQIKTLFDPHNQLNPGKIAVPLHDQQTLVKLDETLRGQYDKQIAETMRDEFALAMVCNGNGACFNYATADVMCPSYKVTQDRVHSPKGRATLMRVWLRELTRKNFIVNYDKTGNFFKKIKIYFCNKPDFSHEVYQAMSGCLACKACASQCPLNVDVPEFKSKFLAAYHQRYLRKWRDYLIAYVDVIVPLQSIFPRFFNFILQMRWVNYLFQKMAGIVNLPLLSTLSIKKALQKRQALQFDFEKLSKLSAQQKKQSVILLQDTFTSFYETQLLLDCYDFLTKLGLTVYIAPFFANGKPLHIKGFLRKFTHLVQQNNLRLKRFAETGISIVGIDPSITLTYRDEYQKVLGKTEFHVFLLQEWLTQEKILSAKKISTSVNTNYYLLAHCTEKTMCIGAEKMWTVIFAEFGLNLTPLRAGCCGMAGSYGHEAEHLENSQALFNMDWQSHLEKQEAKVLATGYSCRSQAQRFTQLKLKHPIQILADLLV